MAAVTSHSTVVLALRRNLTASELRSLRFAHCMPFSVRIGRASSTAMLLVAATVVVAATSRGHRVGISPPECASGELVDAYFGGEVDLGSGAEPCNPTVSECWYPAEIEVGPDDDGIYEVAWSDRSEEFRAVHGSLTRRSLDGTACGFASEKAPYPQPLQEVPCTIVPQFHWEGSTPSWNREAISALRAELVPDEFVEGFDWHVIFRFHDLDHCERAYETLAFVLQGCECPERCYRHPYVKSVEYVGGDPASRRKSLEQRSSVATRGVTVGSTGAIGASSVIADRRHPALDEFGSQRANEL
eukprot:TRINITY_DN58111_c0_g1_i1.p1 TRINITY_DN58111_c0_g1~~TRINITY_DN58111_c0_g1_i1.p1  ORF type:complete len:301 (-),score=24.32 TRINITY_DN58111_c0_g1_i1:129-1031(-)